MAEASFAGKFLQRLKRIDAEQIESFLAQVLREKAFLEAVLDSITDGVVVTEQRSRVVFINDAAKNLLALQRNDPMGRDLRELLKVHSLRRIAEEFEENPEPIRAREVIVHTPRPRLYNVTVMPIENDESLRTHAVWIVSDRTESLRQAQEKQEIENLESLATLTAGVAHEIKNPLNSLNIHAQLMRKATEGIVARHGEDATSSRLMKSTDVILEEIERLKHVVDEFIRAVRPVQPQLRKYGINRVLEALAELVGPECSRRGIELTLNLDPEDPQVMVDPDQIHQAILNVLKNAMEAMDKDLPRIQLRTKLAHDHVLVEVEDNGVGIPEEARLRIFQPYHTTKHEGTGLGLMVVYRIVKAHRGAIGLVSDEGEGTVFSIALPLDERPVRMLAGEVQPDLPEAE